MIREREQNLTLSITAKKGQTLDILVENQGHINIGSGINNNTKVSITGSQTLDILVENQGHIHFGSGNNNNTKINIRQSSIRYTGRKQRSYKLWIWYQQ